MASKREQLGYGMSKVLFEVVNNSADTIAFPKIFSFDSIFHALSDATGIKSIRVKSSVLMRAEFRFCRFSVFCVFIQKVACTVQ